MILNPHKKIHSFSFGVISGFFFGFVFLHPFSMLFQGIVNPSLELSLNVLLEAFDSRHLTMALYFGGLGSCMGGLIVFLISLLSKEKERVKILEGLLPICSYCKKIRDDDGTNQGEGKWVQMETYISHRSTADFSHGICPKCYEKVEEEIERVSSGKS